MNWQYIIVGIIFIGAIAYMARSLFKSGKGQSHCSDCDIDHKKTK